MDSLYLALSSLSPLKPSNGLSNGRLKYHPLVRIPWTARRSNQSILKEISPEYALEELILKLKLQYFGHLMQRTEKSGALQSMGSQRVKHNLTTKQQQ